jgi:16S rRNA A1518/A1519 N6-dimethyltransferase RsmA/KsgA/DIM1 with predicted DNA glycosylase/AP lyase activity
MLLLLLLQINKAFSERRKMMRNTLQPLYTPQQVRTNHNIVSRCLHCLVLGLQHVR